jgi:hypothetical protein
MLIYYNTNTEKDMGGGAGRGGKEEEGRGREGREKERKEISKISGTSIYTIHERILCGH